MMVRGLLAVVALTAAMSSALAQSPVERGKYLVTTIMTCQNCHTPKGERGAPIFERDLSSGLSWDEPPFKVTASNITQDKETGIGSWTEAQIKTALRKGERPNGVHLGGDAVRFLRDRHRE
jgi:mono/diheme cytochrome c family protein